MNLARKANCQIGDRLIDTLESDTVRFALYLLTCMQSRATITPTTTHNFRFQISKSSLAKPHQPPRAPALMGTLKSGPEKLKHATQVRLDGPFRRELDHLRRN